MKKLTLIIILFFLTPFLLNISISTMSFHGCPIKSISRRVNSKCKTYKVKFYDSDSVIFCIIEKINWINKKFKILYFTGQDFYMIQKSDAKKCASEIKKLYKLQESIRLAKII